MGRAEFGAVFDSLGDDANERGRNFELLCKWWLENDAAWRRKVSRVWLWKEYPQGSGPDIGIDLVAEIDGVHWAVQCKAYSVDLSIPKREVDSFLSASATNNFAGRVLIASTDRLSTNARQIMSDLNVVFVNRSSLELSSVDWGSWCKKIKHEVPAISPRPHQQAAVKALMEGFKQADRGQLLMACGTGKSLTALWAMEAMKTGNVLILVPSISLLSQLLRTWTQFTQENWNFLAVCSDETVSSGIDEFESNVIDLGIPATTDENAISSYLGTAGKHIIFSTYQSAERVVSAVRSSETEIDLAIFDEAHRMAGQSTSWGRALLDDNVLKISKRLFMTATPRTFTAAVKAKAQDVGTSLASMDDPELFGRVFFDLSFSEAIKEDLLSDFKIVVLGVSDSEVRSVISNNQIVEAGGTNLEARNLAAQIAVVKARSEFGLQKMITFHSSVRQARSFAQNHAAIAEKMGAAVPNANFVSGEMTSHIRSRRIQELSLADQANPGLLSNARCLTEGIDLPSLDGVAFIDPKGSQVDIIQAVGRAIRKNTGKRFGHILIPVLIPIDEQGVPEDLSEGQYRTIWAVLNALRSHDQAFAQELDLLRREAARTGKQRLPSRVSIELPDLVVKDLLEFAENIEAKILAQTSQNWDWWFGLLQRFVDRMGTASVPQAHQEDGAFLGRWASHQRTNLREPSLLGEDDLERRDLLQSLPGWTWDKVDDFWEFRFRLLEHYVDEFGNARPPNDYVVGDVKLGRFVGTQRYRYKQGMLREERASRLSSLPGWAWNKYDGDWLDYFDELKALNRLPLSSIAEEKSLYWWVSTQRKTQDSIPEWKTLKLESLSFWAWEAEDVWDRNFLEIQKVVRKINPFVFQGTEIKDSALRNWFYAVQRKWKSGELEGDRLARWESLGFADQPLDEVRWNENFDTYRAWRSSNPGSIEIPKSLRSRVGTSIWRWFPKQVDSRRLGTMSPERLRKFNEFVPLSESRDDAWNKAFSALATYGDENGHLIVPKKSHPKIYEWTRGQIKLKKEGSLSDDRIEALEGLDGWSWNPITISFAHGLAAFSKFRESSSEGWPSKGDLVDKFPIGSWVFQMRKMKGWGKLGPAEIAALESLPNWSWSSR